MIVVIDNYDSFTYNLVQLIGSLDSSHDIRVLRNDTTTVDEVLALRPKRIIISPGPCTPNEAGISVDLVRRAGNDVPILGVCLGHQCIAQAYGAAIVRAPRLMHGKTSPVHHGGTGLYYGMTNPFQATRYHSLAIDRSTLSDEFEVTAWSDRDELMGIRHSTRPLEGVQFHPESFLTTEGGRLVSNFLLQPHRRSTG